MFCKCLSFAPYAPYPFIRPALNLVAVCIMEPVNCSYKQLALSYPVSPWKLLKVCPFTLSLVSPLQTCSACECMGCGTNLAPTWHSGLVLSIKATLVKPPFSADSDIMRAFIIVSDTLIKG